MKELSLRSFNRIDRPWRAATVCRPRSLTTDRASQHESVITHTPSDGLGEGVAEGGLASL